VTVSTDVNRSAWDPDVYARFSELRARPFWDLVAGLDTSSRLRSLIDLGCGSGELTAELAAQLDVSLAVGVDSSPEMLERARRHADDRCRFVTGDIATWTAPEPVDLVIANASLHWVPDHAAVLDRWVSMVAPGGQLGVQVPANGDHPSHTCSARVAEREPFRSAMGGDPPPDPVVANVLRPEEYAELLFELGIDEPDVSLRVYPQLMTTSSDVVEWTRGTSLTRFLSVLPTELHDPFVDAYRTELLATIGDRAPYFYTFKRILMVGRITRPGRSTTSPTLSPTSTA
jgi:trans-aconitate 2-methyltransferase